MSRYLIALALLIVGLYALVFLTGPAGSPKDKLTPKLGLDLQGGTTVTLRAALPDGGKPSKGQLNEARQIIENRVNGSGVSEFEVLTEGDRNIIVNVPGKNEEDLKKIGEPAQLRFRQVIAELPGTDRPENDPSLQNPVGAKRPTKDEVLAKFPAEAQPIVAAAAGAQTPVDLAANPGVFDVVNTLTPAEVAALPADYQFYIPSIGCDVLNARPAGSITQEDQQVVSCRKSGTGKLLLDKAEVLGTDVKSADFGFDNSQGWVVSIKFTGKGQDRWTELTKKAQGQQVAIVLDNQTVSDPTIENVITGDAQINGQGIGKSEAEDISNKLKYGALPLTFSTDTVYEISPTLGTSQLKAGLLAGGIGLALVVLYSMLYYRLLGLITIASLIASGTIIYASIILLGREMGFTLTLAGVAGFIVSIGITADSFVVFFERLKDEVRDGRTVRSAVPRAWARSRRTILSADAVSFLAAAVLYILAIGAVKGFAFTLGLSTIVDVLIVFWFTHPLVVLLSRTKIFASPKLSGLVKSERSNSAVSATATKEA
ncbi:MAG: protein translocase subunit SecD [Corynebacteriales bacterium]|nr:protein translocase subunit SecD [Mycobacteriales bacterium]